ncbi:hypothetical protein [Thalassobaculum sp.]
MTPSRRHNPLALIPDEVLAWLGICAVIVGLGVPAVLDAIVRS